MGPDILADLLRLERQYLIRHLHVWAFTAEKRHVSSFILEHDVDGAEAWSREVAERYGRDVRFFTMECESTICHGGQGLDRGRWVDDERAAHEAAKNA